MARHLAVNANVYNLTVQFKRSNKKKIFFPKTFNHPPAVTITLDNQADSPPYKYQVKRNHCWIRFKGRYSGIVSVRIEEQD